MVNCPSCSAHNSETSKFCSQCGSALKPEYAATATYGNKAASGSGEGDVSSAASDSSHHGRFLPGTKIADRYRIVSLVGKGGMGEVYRADDLKLGHTVALKFLPKDLANEPQRLGYFHSEVRLTRQISHPNVCRVYDIGEVDGQHFLSMEYIDGEDLRVLLRRIGRLPKDKGVQIAQQLCAGLAAAHEQGVLHRDLKPANVMIDGRGQVRITDFGLAQVAEDAKDGQVAGTPAYMAPEQLSQGETTVQTDLYSLGLILYEVFTGRQVYQSGTVPDLLRQHAESSLSQPSSLVDDMDPAVERVILRCLEREPQERPRSAHAVAGALPGGDPLAAALAAGETPSPEMIAAAGETGGLSLKVGGGLVAVVCALLAALSFFADWLDTFQLSRLKDNEPAVLKKIATDLIAERGFDDRPADSVYGYELGEDNQLQFWYRQSSQAIDPNLPNLWMYPPAWSVTSTNPSPYEPSMVTIRLDGTGQLLAFLAVPEVDPVTEKAGAEPDWDELFAAVGLDRADFQPSPATQWSAGWLPPVYADAVTVWRDRSSVAPRFQVVTATRSGRLVYFRRLAEDRSNGIAMILNARVARQTAVALFLIVMIGFAGLLALRNLRLGRTDTKGALRCAMYYFCVDIVLWTVVGHHGVSLDSELVMGANYLIRSLAMAFRIWLYYVALEPFVRRLWPDVLISWSRVLAGRLNDPLVGRDLLIGCLFGVAWCVMFLPTEFLPFNLGPNTIIGGQFVLAYVLAVHQYALLSGIVSLAFLLLLRVVFRNTWLAAGAFTVLMTLLMTWGFSSPAMWIVHIVFTASLAALYIRYGLVSVISGTFTLTLLMGVPHTADFSAWYADAGKFALVTVLIVAGYSFFTSTLAGRTLITDEL